MCPPLLCSGQESICVNLDCLVAWGVIGLKKVVIVLCGWACVAVLLSFNNVCVLATKVPMTIGPSYSITVHSGPKPCLKRQCYLPLIWCKSRERMCREITEGRDQFCCCHPPTCRRLICMSHRQCLNRLMNPMCNHGSNQQCQCKIWRESEKGPLTIYNARTWINIIAYVKL